jgi:peptidoglycan glycosyltransferase
MSASAVIEFLESLFTDEAWISLSVVLRWGFLLLFARCIFRLLLTREPADARKKKGRQIGLGKGWGWIWALGLLLLAGRQATWQLLGRRQPEFIAFMQRYDRREFNPAHQVRPGRIQDRYGQDLAVSAVTDSGIRRVYRFGSIFAHVVGYNHPVYGMTGLESAARKDLMGQGLGSPADLKALGAELLNRDKFSEGPVLKTTLDAGLQRRAAELLGDRRGAVVVLEVSTGAVRCLVSHPSFDPNRLRQAQFRADSADAPLLNRALQGRYPPGSVFKILIAAAALDAGFQGTLDTPPEGFTTSASTPPIRDHGYYTAQERGERWRGHGRLDLGTALAASSNVFFAQLGIEVGADALTKTIGQSGLTRPFSLWDTSASTLAVRPASGIELSDRRPYEIAQFSIGQGNVLVTPMHLALLSAAVAGGGVVPEPRLVAGSSAGSLGRLCSPESAETLKWMMYKVVQEGTGRGIRIPGLAVAGKTGTAETGEGRHSHSWFAGFAPVSDPHWAFCVLVEEGGYGSTAALPIARDLLQSALRRGEFAP